MSKEKISEINVQYILIARESTVVKINTQSMKNINSLCYRAWEDGMINKSEVFLRF